MWQPHPRTMGILLIDHTPDRAVNTLPPMHDVIRSKTCTAAYHRLTRKIITAAPLNHNNWMASMSESCGLVAADGGRPHPPSGSCMSQCPASRERKECRRPGCLDTYKVWAPAHGLRADAILPGLHLHAWDGAYLLTCLQHPHLTNCYQFPTIYWVRAKSSAAAIPHCNDHYFSW